MKITVNGTCKAHSKGGSKTCDKPKGHVGQGDLRHRDGAWKWGGYGK